MNGNFMRQDRDMSRKLLQLFLVVVLALSFASPAHAFRSTKQETFTDPDYIGYKPKTVMVSVLADDFEVREVIEKRLSRDLRKKGLTVYAERDLFLPTRQLDAAQREAVLAERQVDAIIIIGIGASSNDVSQMGSSNLSTGYGSSTSVPFISAKSRSSFGAVLIDATNGRTAWTTDIFTKAGGLLFAGGNKDAKACAKAVVKGLAQSGHLVDR